MLPRVKDQVRCDSRSAARGARTRASRGGVGQRVVRARPDGGGGGGADPGGALGRGGGALFLSGPGGPGGRGHRRAAAPHVHRQQQVRRRSAPAADKARATDACTQSPARPLSLALPSLTGCGVARCVAAETCARRRCATSPSPRAACPPSSSGFATPRTTCAPSLPPPPLRQPTWHSQPTLNSRLFSLSPGGRL